jgi:hypothetical protein
MNSTEWLTIPETVIEAHQSKMIIYRWINNGWIDSFVLKSHPDSQAGIRLVRRSSLLAFMDKQFKEQQLKPPFVRGPHNKRKEVAA